MILTRSRSLDTGYEDLDDATRITLISLRLVQQGTQREALTKFYENAKSFFLLKTKTNTYSVSEQKDKNRHGPSKQFGPKL